MKSLFCLCILMALLQAGAYPQKIERDFKLPDSAPCFLRHENQLSPFAGQKLSNKNLRKARTDIESGDPVYRPSEILIDSSKRYIRTYDNKGNLLTETEENNQDGSLVRYFRRTFKYDSIGNLLMETRFIWSNSCWNYYSRVIYTYDINDNLRYQNWEFFADTAWVNNFRNIYDYDSNGRRLSSLYQRLEDGCWTDFTRISSTYSDNGSTIMQENFVHGAWVKIGRVTYSFDNAGNELSYLYERWGREAWVKTNSSAYTYDSRGNRISEIYEDWQDGILSRRDRITNSYDIKGSCTSTLNEAWQDSTFVKRWLTTRAYDEAGNQLSVISQFPSGNSRENAFRITYTYDGNGNAVKGESFSWDGGEWEYSSTPFSDYNFRYNRGKDQLDQLPVSGAVVKIRYDLLPEEDPSAVRDFALSQNYPNPFNPSTAINYFIKSDGRVRLTVYDALGKVVTSVVDEYKTAGSYSVRFDGSRLPSGVYIYRLESAGYSTAKKFILMK